MTLDLIIDVEATCWENNNDWRARGSEIIEIGAIICQTGEARSFMIRPTTNPVLSEFCTKLTTITQAQIDTAQPFVTVIAEFVKWVAKATGKPLDQIKWGSWGFYDVNILESNCSSINVPMPLARANHTNVKLFSLERLGMRKGGVETALHKLNIGFSGTPHRGIDDARMINVIYQAVLAQN